MTPEKVRELFLALQQWSVDYILVGAVALDVLGIGRFTEAVDIFVHSEYHNIERLKKALCTVWQDSSIDEIKFEGLAGEYPVIQYVAPDGFRVDILARLGEAFSYEDLKYSEYIYGDVKVKVATPSTLYALKKDTTRLQDRADAEKLKKRFDLKD